MSPKSASGGCVSSITESDEEEPIAKNLTLPEDYRKWDRPFGLVEQHVFNFLNHAISHAFTAYYLYVAIFKNEFPFLSTFIFGLFWGYLSGLGITVGCHRYWTHKTFKAKLPLQILLMIMQSMSCQLPIWKWTLDHRIHHKYTDTDADPHNSKRGFWFSHITWLFLPKHPELQKRLETFDMPDLINDPVVRFQSRWYGTLLTIFHWGLPTLIFWYVWDMSLVNAFAANCTRYIFSLHFTFTVNSVAHMWGDKPYDKNISPVENPIVALLAIGEGWHNYHHTFPWDYKASEFGWKINISTMFIDFFAWLGWAYDLKTVSQKMLKERLLRTGDGSHLLSQEDSTTSQCVDDNDNDFDFSTPADVTELMKTSIDTPIWGWDDENIPEEFRQVTRIIRPEKCH